MKKLLTTTALFALLSGSALAQGISVNTDTNVDASSSSDTVLLVAQANIDTRVSKDDIGTPVYSSTLTSGVVYGDLSDIVDSDGAGVADWAIIDMGGKNVAVSLDELRWGEKSDGQRVIYTTITMEELEAMEAYVR